MRSREEVVFMVLLDKDQLVGRVNAAVFEANHHPLGYLIGADNLDSLYKKKLLCIQQDVCPFKFVFVLNVLLILNHTALQVFGFIFLSLSSSDFDECSLEPNPCDNNANCTNIEGSYTCACKLGYSGDGADCQGIS